MQPAGQDPEACVVPGTVTLPLCVRTKCQSFLDNVIAGLGQIGSWKDPRIGSQGRPGRSATARIYEFAMGNLAVSHKTALADPFMRRFANSPWTRYGIAP